jgi:fructokinase
MLTQADAVTLPKEAHALYFGGISLATLPCQEFYLETLARNSEGRVVMIDPNIRPAFIADEMQYRAVLTDAFERVDIVKVSDEDLDWIDQSDASLEEKARTLLGRGPSVVIITRGGDGALIYLTGSDAPVIVAAQKVTVADTVGAGDSFNAGFLANLEDNGLLSPEKIANLSADQAREAAQFAASVAAITVTRQGANPPWRDELTA